MIYIDDAGTGCIIGNPIIAINMDGDISYIELQKLNKETVCKAILELFSAMNIDKNEEIRVCRGNIFSLFTCEAINLGYKNIKRIRIEDEIADFADSIFIKNLYNLGISKDVKLIGKDYEYFYNEIFNQIILNPDLINHVRPHILNKPQYTRLVYIISRMENEFPNLYTILKNVK